MGSKIFTEKKINAAILTKAPLQNIKSGKHVKGNLIVDNRFFGKITLPNPHKNKFWEGKARKLAGQLLLSAEEYNRFIVHSQKKRI